MEAMTKSDSDTDAEREQAAEIRHATTRATAIRRKELEIEKLRAEQHAFILKANNPPPGWKKLSPIRISEIVKISRQRIHELILRATPEAIPEEVVVDSEGVDPDAISSV